MRKHIAPSQGLDSGPWHIHQQTSRLSTVRPDSPTLICKGPNPEIKNQQNVCEKEITGTVEDRNLKDPDDVYEEPYRWLVLTRRETRTCKHKNGDCKRGWWELKHHPEESSSPMYNVYCITSRYVIIFKKYDIYLICLIAYHCHSLAFKFLNNIYFSFYKRSVFHLLYKMISAYDINDSLHYCLFF